MGYDIFRKSTLSIKNWKVGFSYVDSFCALNRADQDQQERNHLYVVQLELLLASALGTDGLSNEIQDSTTFDGTPPPHFYGELVKTEEGCQILEASGHFAEFSTFIRQHGLEDFDSDVIARLKSVLWAIVCP